jgi:hypothetical protein
MISPHHNIGGYLESVGKLPTFEEKIAHLLMLRLPPDVAARRATQLVADMNSVGLTLAISVTRAADEYQHRGLLVPVEYNLHGAPWDINHRDPNFALDGSELDAGDLFHLARVCEIGRRLIPDLWPLKLKKGLASGEHHLNTLNEVWWLNRFKSPTDIVNLDLVENDAPDWSFKLHCHNLPLPVRAEVKRRTKDIKRHIGMKPKSKVGLFGDIAHKFPTRNPGGLNLAAITLYSEIDEHIREATCEWLRKTPTVDAVLLWSHQSLNSAPAAIGARGDVESLLQDGMNHPDDEDMQAIGLVRHPLSDLPFPFPQVDTTK